MNPYRLVAAPAPERGDCSYPYTMLRRRRSRDAATGRTRHVRQWIIPTIGAVTPIALIAVNLAAFIVHHLAEFRVLITALAFVSAMMLNSWTGLRGYRRFKDRHGGHALVHDSNQDIVLIVGMALIIVISAVTAVFCYLGLSNERDLPNVTTFLTGVLAILVPIVLQRFFNSGSADSAVARPVGGALPGVPPIPPAPTPFADPHVSKRQ